jgi:hypothetical protein
MPRYFFTVAAGENGTWANRAAELHDDAAALAYACELARELRRGDDHTDLKRSLVKVSDDTRPMVLSIPLLAGCA